MKRHSVAQGLVALAEEFACANSHDPVSEHEGQEVIAIDGAILPVVSLAATLGLPLREPLRGSTKVQAVVVAAAEQRLLPLAAETAARSPDRTVHGRERSR